MVDTLEDVDISALQTPFEEESRGDKQTHIINPPNNLHIWREGMEVREIVEIARLRGYPVRALCGYTWMPVADPEKFPACHECIRIAGELMREAGE